MNDIAVYQAADPAKVREVMDAWQAEADAWDERVKQWCAEQGGRRAIRVDNRFSEYRLLGIFVDGDETPANWRRFKTKDHLEPNRQRKAGKALDAEMAELNEQHPGHLRAVIAKHFEVPLHFGIFSTFGFEPVPLDDPSEFFVLWREEHGWEGNPHFPRVATSAYYLAKERVEAA